MLEKLPIDLVELICDHLPVEVSFVGDDDTVRYYSHGEKRIFKRTPAVIGRKVQNCHPAKSVDKVVQIVNDFKSGKRNAAEFWINMNGKLIYIRYFAVRDAAGKYKGTLEVTQDVTGIKKLEGEKRLLDG
jgi:uncharacterized protein